MYGYQSKHGILKHSHVTLTSMRKPLLTGIKKRASDICLFPCFDQESYEKSDDKLLSDEDFEANKNCFNVSLHHWILFHNFSLTFTRYKPLLNNPSGKTSELAKQKESFLRNAFNFENLTFNVSYVKMK